VIEYLTDNLATQPIILLGTVRAGVSPALDLAKAMTRRGSGVLTLLAQGAPYRSPMLSFMFANAGNPETERDMLWDRSPLSRIDDIRIPILVAQGANDVRVTRNEAEQIVAALKAKGLPHEYLLFPDEGHGLMKAENREIYYAAVERFLAEHLDD
jgi:dipeptidyl aminopeptidase/acylaminoacyl peptidase